jgi:nitrogen-specific signal transduction histidine kinase/CheY-like chemotaxis protein
MILIIDTELKIVFYNEKAEKFLEKISPEDRNLTRLMTQQSIEVGFDESLRNIIRNGEYIKQINVLNPLQEGFQYVDLIIEPIKTTTGIIGGLIIMRDISEWRSLTEKIKNLQEFMGKLIDASPIAIISVNEYDSATIWNQAAERLFKTPSSRALKKNIFEIHPFFLSYKDVINEVKVLNKPIFLADQRMDFEDEPQSVLNLNLYPVQSEGRNVVVMVEDISEVRKLEDSLIQAQKMESLGLLTSGIIHDFNNVLSGIVGYASLLEQKITESEELRKYSTNIIASGERASSLIRQILDFSKKKLSRKEVLDINAVIEELLGFLKVNLRNIQVVKNLAERSIRLSADKTKMSQVIINLIINAKEALADTADPEIRVGTEEISVKGRENLIDGTYAQITVSDNGPGISQDNIQRIFEPFFSTKDKGKSTGLGLAIVSDIIRDYHGEIELESQPGKGTTFKILIPSLKEEIYEAPKPVTKSLESDLEGAVLLIDDEAVIREIGRDMLDSMGLGCFTAADGEEGIRVYEEHKDTITLVLLDIEMPGLSGDRVAETLRKMNPDVKILFSSGYTQDYLESKVFKGKIDHFIPKPFHLNQLSDTLNKLLRE